MPDWSRRRLLAAAGAVGAAGAGGWALATRCRPLIEPQWSYVGRHRLGPTVPSTDDLLLPEGYGVTGSEVDHRLAAVEPFGAQVQWTVVAEGGGFGAPVRAGDTVYVGTGRDTVRALDAETGERRWTYDPGGREAYGGGAWGRPLVTDDLVSVGISHSSDPNADPTDPDEFTHRVVALDRADGTEAWATPVSGQVWAGPVSTSGVVVAAARPGTLHGLDPDTGASLWEFSLPDRVTRPLSVVAEGAVAVVTDDGTVAFVDVPDATIRRTRTPVRGATDVARTADTLYVAGADGRVAAIPTAVDGAIDAETGAPRWTYDAGLPIDAVAAAEGTAFAVDRTGHRHRIVGGDRTARDRLVETPHTDGCGWDGDLRRIFHARVHRGGLYVAGRFWTRLYPVEGDG